MSNIRVSTTSEVLERFRIDLLDDVRSRGFTLPREAEIPGNYFDAVVAWQRLQHRTIHVAPRAVNESRQLLERQLDPAIQLAIADIRSEFERGDDLTPRLTRHFFRTAFNDFLFNNFGIHHLHLGLAGAGLDKTKKHTMSGGRSELLFALVTPTEAYFLDIQDHLAFDSPDVAKALARVALGYRPDLLEPHVAHGVVHAEQTFEDAFRLAKAGFSTVYELDGRFFLTGGTVMDGRVTNGKRAACTSEAAIGAANLVLTMIVQLVEHVTAYADELSTVAELRGGAKPQTFDLEVVQVGPSVVVRDLPSGLLFFNNGRRLGLL
ncbi:MAG TPA: hypothetical protein VJV79_29945 [Polyangiaceae bacterium]|nr:hypothetical protein [Polyangiaceae bacterium]